MNKLPLYALAAAIVAAPVRAQTVAGSVAETTALHSAVSGAILTVGAERIGALGSTALTNLTTLTPQGQLPLTATPGTLTPLVEALQAGRATPESFAALSAEGKLAALKLAALAAEDRAAKVAAEAIDAASKPIRIKTYAPTAVKVSEAEALSSYLPKATAEQVDAARAAVEIYRTRSGELLNAFLVDLPDKIAAGEFNGTNFIRHDEDGWYAADEAPGVRHADLRELYYGRLNRIDRNPVGPWTAAEYSLLLETLKKPENVRELDLPMTSKPLLVHYSRLPSWRLGVEIAARQWKLSKTYDPTLRTALSRFAAGKPRGRDIKAVEKFYDSSLQSMRLDWTSRARITSWIRTGGDGLPGWAAIKALKRALERRYDRNVSQGMVAFFAALLAAVATGSHWTTTAEKIAETAVVFAPMIWMYFNLLRRKRFDIEEASIDTRLERHFKR